MCVAGAPMRQLTPFVAAIVVLSGCRDNSPLQQNPPSLNALIVDGAHSGNKDFFFLPPLVPSPVGSQFYDAGKFNAHLAPVAEVCELAANPILVPTTDCKAGPLVFGPATMALDLINQQYQLNWDTQASGLILTSFYRITVRGSARGTALGLLDVDPVLGGVKNLTTGDLVQFQNGRTLPIKVRIEQGAFGSSNSNDFVEQVVPNVLPATGLDVTTNTGFAGAHFSNGWLPIVNGQPLNQVVVIIERVGVNNGGQTRCLNTSFEQLEGCYRFRTDPDLHTLVAGTDLLFSVPVIAGVCFQFPGDVGHSNDHPFELYRSEEIAGRVTPAQPLLDEVPASFLRCDGFGPTPPSIGAAFRSGRLGDIATAGWFAVAQAIGRIIQPRALYGVDLGAGGSTNEFSRFGFLRPASMSVNSGNGAIAPAGSTVQASVKLQNNHTHGISEVDETSPVVGQSVTFTVTAGGGTVSTASCSAGNSCPAVTVDPDGIATVSWTLELGVNTLQVTTDEVSNSPLAITATGTPATFTVQTRLTGLEYPLGLWISNSDVYLTETADHNTSFGGRRRLSKFLLEGSQLTTLIDNPVNSDALVVANDGSIYLASYVGTSPGESGRVSVATQNVSGAWTETALAAVAIAAHDMVLAPNEDIYLIGSSDSPAASSLYLLPQGGYATPAVLATGLGRSWSIAYVNGDLYYSVLDQGEVHSISDGLDQVVFTHPSVTTMTYDGTYLYYGDLAGNLVRRNLQDGTEVTMFSGAGQINALRFYAPLNTLFFLRSGTVDAQFKDGSLNSISLGPVIQ